MTTSPRPWLLGAGGVLLVAAALVIALLVLRDDAERPPLDHALTRTAVAEGAALAWSASLPDGMMATEVVQEGATVVVLAADTQAVDVTEGVWIGLAPDGTELWRRTDLPVSPHDPPQPQDTGLGLVVLRSEERVTAIHADTGRDAWTAEIANESIEVSGQAVVVQRTSGDDLSGVVWLDRDSGDELATAGDRLLDVGADDQALVSDGSELRLMGPRGAEVWAAGLEDHWTDSTVPVAGAIGGDVVAVSLWHWDDDQGELVGLDPGDGDELWTEGGTYDSPAVGTEDGVVFVELSSSDDGLSYDSQTEPGVPLAIRSFDEEGEAAARGMELPASLGYTEVDGVGYLMVGGPRFGSGATEAGPAVLDDELEVVLEGPVAGFTADGVYRLGADGLEVLGWADGQVRHVVPLDSGAAAVWALDRAVAVAGVGSVEVYR